MDFYRIRRNGLLRSAKADEADAYLITDPTNVRYLCGVRAAGLLVTAKAAAAVCDERTAARLAGEEARELVPFPARLGGRLEQVTAEAVQKLGCRAVAVEAAKLPVGVFQGLAAACPKVAFKPVADRVEALRASKDGSEVEAIRAAVRMAERAYTMFRVVMRESETEVDLGHLMDRFVRQAGAVASSVPVRVALGENGGDPDHQPSGKKMGEVTKGLVTWGADAGYVSVLARAFRSPFEPPLVRKTKFERTGHSYDKVTKVVRDAHKAALAEVRAGAEVAAVVAAARKVAADAGYGEFFQPELGHGVGLEVREYPTLDTVAAGTLTTGMVLSIAPDVRIPGWGGVKYNTLVLVTKEGYSELTSGSIDLDM
jgi:Xaa-Pro aminopeptidase